MESKSQIQAELRRSRQRSFSVIPIISGQKDQKNVRSAVHLDGDAMTPRVVASNRVMALWRTDIGKKVFMADHRKPAFAVVLVCVIATVSGSAGSSSGNSVVQISPSSAVLAAGQQFQFTAVTNVPNPPLFLWRVNRVVANLLPAYSNLAYNINRPIAVQIS